MEMKIDDEGEPSNGSDNGYQGDGRRQRDDHRSWMQFLLGNASGRADIYMELASGAESLEDLEIAITCLMHAADRAKAQEPNAIRGWRAGTVGDIAARMSRVLRAAIAGDDRDLQRMRDGAQSLGEAYVAANSDVERAIAEFGKVTPPQMFRAKLGDDLDDIPASELWSAQVLRARLSHTDFHFRDLNPRFAWTRLRDGVAAAARGRVSHGSKYIAAELTVEARAFGIDVVPEEAKAKLKLIRDVTNSISVAVSRRKSAGTK